MQQEVLSLIARGAFGETPRQRQRARSHVEGTDEVGARAALEALGPWVHEEESWALQADPRSRVLRGRLPIATILRAVVEGGGSLSVADGFRAGVRAIWVLSDFDDPGAMYAGDELRELASYATRLSALAQCLALGHGGRFSRGLVAALLFDGSAASLELVERGSISGDLDRMLLGTLNAFAVTAASRALVQRSRAALDAWRRDQEIWQIARAHGFGFEPPHRPEANVVALGDRATLHLCFDVDARLCSPGPGYVPAVRPLTGPVVAFGPLTSCTFDIWRRDPVGRACGSIDVIGTLPGRMRAWSSEWGIEWDYPRSARAMFPGDERRRTAFLAWLSGM